jgi:hypothetical protein
MAIEIRYNGAQIIPAEEGLDFAIKANVYFDKKLENDYVERVGILVVLSDENLTASEIEGQAREKAIALLKEFAAEL